MKRDLELIREILLFAKEADGDVKVGVFTDDERDGDCVSYHFSLLKQAGFANATVFHADDKIHYAVIHSLTWDGHEFAEAIASKRRWKEAKKRAAAMCGSFSVQVLASLAVQMMQQQAGAM